MKEKPEAKFIQQSYYVRYNIREKAIHHIRTFVEEKCRVALLLAKSITRYMDYKYKYNYKLQHIINTNNLIHKMVHMS